jgi:hypothetical protein
MKRLGLALLLLGLTTEPAAAQIYHWADPGGVQYYTTDFDRIPVEYRETARIIYSTPRDPAPRLADSASEAQDPAQTGGESGPNVGNGGTPPAGGTGTTLVSRGGVIMVGANLNGVPLTLLVDTGASKTMISPAALSRAGLDSSSGQPVGMAGASGTGDGIEITVPRLDVAGTQVGPLAVVAHEVSASGADGLLGRDILSGYILMIDVGRSRVTLAR